jgi:hypothetical protein
MPLSRLTRKRSRRSKNSRAMKTSASGRSAPDGATCVIDEHEVAIGQQRAIAIAGIGPVLRPGEHEHRPLDLAEGFIGQHIERCQA